MKPLKIAVYYPWVYLKGGVERSMAALISRSRHDWTVFTSHYEPANTFEAFTKFKVVQIGAVSVRRDMGAVFKAALNIIGTRLPLTEFDGYAVWCDGLGTLTTFRNSRIPTFCICSTPLRAVYDPVYVRDSLHNRRPLAKLVYQLFKHSFRFVDRLAWSRFDGVVATSLEVKERIVRNRLYPDDARMALYHPGIDVGDAPKQVSYEPFLLVPGRISWTKNIELAIDAFLRAGLPAPWRLVVAGFVDQKSRRYLEELKQRAGGNARIEFVVSPSDEELNRLYETAYAVLFTPLNEDWGMAVLEGMLRSKPVIANASGGPKESVIDGATGWLLEPEVGQWSALLRGLPGQAEAVRNMGAQARLHVEKYDWKRFVNGVDGLIESTIRKTSRTLPSKSKPNALTP
jgi:glycosyltransferase involved in cell wall biosynthesis